MINQQQLKEILEYDPNTGIFTWIVNTTRNGLKAGRKATCLDVHGYGQINIKGTVYKTHRLAWLYMTGAFPESQIDHINHDRSDNRWVNLRCVNNMENHRNRPKQSNNKSGVVGVYQCNRTGAWIAYIHANKKRLHLGRFNSIEDAAKVRKEAEIKYGFHENHGKTEGRPAYYKEKLKELQK